MNKLSLKTRLILSGCGMVTGVLAGIFLLIRVMGLHMLLCTVIILAVQSLLHRFVGKHPLTPVAESFLFGVALAYVILNGTAAALAVAIVILAIAAFLAVA